MTYRYLTNLADLLRKAGFKVEEIEGWKTRGRPPYTGGFDPVGVLCHHTATNKSTSVTDVIRLLVNGRSDLPGPLCQLSLGRDGTVYVVAAGRANHAGVARASGTVAAGDGNTLYIGIEAMNDGVGEPWPSVQYDTYVRLCAVLSDQVTGNSVQTVRGHKETSVTGKIDPTFDMNAFRTRVGAAMKDDAPKPDPQPHPNGRQLELGSFNVERGRPKKAAVGDVLRLFDKWDLDGLTVQEAEGYFQEFTRLADLDLFADPENPENGILVPAGRGSDFLSADYGDGWERTGGAHRGAGVFPRVTIDGWLRLASIHYPPSTTWPGGQLHTPPARRDDVIEIAEKAKAYLERDNLTRVVAGDWNEPPTTAGTYSPLWVANETGSEIQAPKSREGHGRIDFGIVKRGRMVNVRKDTEIREGSDHEPVIFTVIETQE